MNQFYLPLFFLRHIFVKSSIFWEFGRCDEVLKSIISKVGRENDPIPLNQIFKKEENNWVNLE